MLTGRPLPSVAIAIALAASSVVLSAQQQVPPAATTAEAARAFLEEANRELLRLVNASNRAGWTQGTYITRGYRADLRRGERRANERRDPLCEGGAPLRRRDAAAGRAPPVRRAEELADDVGAAGSEGGGGAHAPGRVDGGRVRAAASTARSGATGDDCLDIEAITEILAESRDPKWLQEVWEGLAHDRRAR